MKKSAGRLALAIATPLGFAVAPVLSLCKSNPSEIPLSDLPRPLAVSALTGLALLGLTTLFCRRDPARGSVAASLILLFGWYYAEFSQLAALVLNPILNDFPATVISNIPQISLGLWFLLAGGIALLCSRWRGSLERVLGVLAPMSAALLFLAIPWRSQHTPSTTTTAPRASPAPNRQAVSTSDLPDLYVIVLDAYGRHDVLKTLYDFDDGPFVDGLKSRGFQVAEKSRANYLQTALAVGALFQLDYWQSLEVPKDATDAVSVAGNLSAGSALTKILRERGYHNVAISTASTIEPSSAETVLQDSSVPPGYFSELENLALDRTPLTLLPRGQNADYGRHRQKLRGALRFLGEPPPGPVPHFVFCHILAPHPPFVLGANGEDETPSEPFHIGDATDFSPRGGNEGYRKSYADQATFIGKSVLAALDRLKASSKRPAAFLILGDHGPRRFTDWNDLSKTYVPEGFANLVAVSVPEESRARLGALPEEITPINAARRFLNATLKTDLKPLPDRSYFSTLKNGFVFTDVTDAARAPANLAEAERVHPQSR